MTMMMIRESGQRRDEGASPAVSVAQLRGLGTSQLLTFNGKQNMPPVSNFYFKHKFLHDDG